MSTLNRRGVSVVWVSVIMVVVAIVAAALILSYFGATTTQVCPAQGCKGVTSLSSSSSMTINIGPHDVSTTFEYPGVPSSFNLGTYTFSMVYNDSGYVSANGTQYPGFDVVFNVANRTQSQAQVVIFEWSPITGLGPSSSTRLPSPSNASVYLDTVTMAWTATSPAYPNAKGVVAFLTVTVYQKPPNY